MTRRPAPTPSGDGLRARPTARSDAAWSATSPASSTDSSKPPQRFDQHRSVKRNDMPHASRPVQVATQIYLLAAQANVVEGQLDPRWSGYCSPVAATEPVGFMAGSRPSKTRQPPPARPSRGEEVLMP